MQQVQVSEKQMFDMIAKDFFQSLVQSKHMLVQSTNDVIESALSPMMEKSPIECSSRYGVEHYKQTQKFRLQIWMFVKEHSEPEFRQVELSYKEIFEDLLQHGGGKPLDVADRMYRVLGNITQRDWDNLMVELDKKPIDTPTIKL